MEPVSTVGPTQGTGRGKSGILFPAYGLADSLAVAEVIHNKAGGYATREQLAAFLEYKSTENGSFWSRIGAAKMFGLIAEENGQLRLTQTAQRILMPESEDQQRAALVEAFLNVPLFKALYQEYQGKDLPQGLGLQNALRSRFKVVPKRVDLAIKNFLEAAENAKFFETRGSKTQLIIPVIKTPPKTPPADPPAKGDRGGGGEEPPKPPLTRSRDELQNDYIATLIELLRDKSSRGDVDSDLMERIERLLDLKTA